MTIRRDMEQVTVVVYTTGLDDYGQSRLTQSSTRQVEMFIRPYSNSNVNNPKFNDYELIALTKDRSVNVCNSIQYNQKHYDVMYIIPSSRYNQLFLRELK